MAEIQDQAQAQAPPNQLFNDSDDSAAGSGVIKIHPDDEYIQFGNKKYLKSELVKAFGGTLNPGLSPPPRVKLGNPSPLGLSAFALTTFVLSLVNVQARGVKVPNIVVGLGFFYGGFAQFLAGLFEIALGNTFGALALCSYGGFWASYAAILTDSFGIMTAFGDEEQELANALGIFLVAWFIFTFFMTAMTLKSTVAFFSVFFFLTITFLLLAIGEFTGRVAVTKAGGVFGLITAFSAWYNAYAGIADPTNTYFPVRAIGLPDLQDKAKYA